MNRADAIIIGAGPNGLAAATLLAKRGKKVLVLERRNIVGGIAASEEFHPGYRTSGLLADTTGVSAAVVDALELPRHGLTRRSEPPDVFAPRADGGGLLLAHDPARAAEELARHSERDAKQYLRFRKFMHNVRNVVQRVMDRPPPDITAMSSGDKWSMLATGWALRRLGKQAMMEVMRIAPMCVADWVGEWFESDLLKATLAGPAVYPSFTGPWSPGTAASLLVRETLAGGSVIGGPGALVAALERAATDNGVIIRTEAEVEEILVEGGRVRGVRLTGGEEIPGDLVGASCDPRRTFLDLVSSRELPYELEHGIRHYRGYGTVAKVDLAVEGPLEFTGRTSEGISFVHIASDIDAIEKSFDPVKYGELPEVPSLEIHLPTVEDASLAPEGHTVVSVLAHFIPYRLEGGWNDDAREKLGDLVVRTLSNHAPTVPSQIRGRRVLTPVDLEREYGLVEGHPWHGDHTLDQLLLRPTPETARYRTPVDGLFLCGSGSHPGGGITLVPGALGARAMLGG